MPVKYSPATLSGLNFTIEQVDHVGSISRLSIEARGPHKIAAAGMRALVTRFNTYYGTTLSAAQVSAILTAMPFGMSLVDIGQTGADFFVQSADVATLSAGVASDLQGAGAAVAG